MNTKPPHEVEWTMTVNTPVASGLVVDCEGSQQSSSGPSPGSQCVKSDIWHHFEKSGDRAKFALCKLCNKQYAYYGGMSNLQEHLTCTHRNKF